MNVNRPDLAAAHPQIPHAATAGFSLDVVLGDDAGSTHLVVSVELANGTQILLGTVRLAGRTAGGYTES